MPGTPDITIIGGGIISLLTAKEFSDAGATVTIIEKNRLGQEASWAGGGILLPLYPWRQHSAISTLVRHSVGSYAKLAHALLNETGIDPEWVQCGLLITRNPDIALAKSWCQKYQTPFSSPNATRLQPFNVEPLNPLWLPSIAQARNPRLLKALIKYLAIKKVAVIENCALENVTCQQKRIHSISTSQGNRPVNHLILATGAWSGELWNRLFTTDATPKPDIKPVTGQMLLFDAEPGVLKHMILDQDQYLIPRRDGKILAGSTVEARGFEKNITADAKQQLETFALNLFPALKDFPLLHHWAGLRPGTPQGVPYIAIHPHYHNLSINAGHFRNGLVMGPASAKLLADLVLQRPTTIDPAPYKFETQH